jgi:cytochrome bd-type quinol oxidase subunit 1
MITGAILGVIIVLIVVAYSKLGKNGQENIRKTGNVVGWLFGIAILVGIFFSAYLTLSK